MLSICHIQNLFSQNHIEKINVNWGESLKKIESEKEFYLPTIVGQDYNGYSPHFSQEFKIGPNQDFDLQIQSKELELSNNNDIVFLNAYFISVPTEINLTYKSSKNRNKNTFTLSFFPFVKENNQIYRIKSLSIKFNSKAVQIHHPKDFVNESVLNDVNSQFYKINVKSDGIHKLDKSWFELNGISISNPNQVNIYGNGAGKLSEQNSDPKIDDLAKNAILFVGNNDANFDDNEYFLFYGWGPNRWINSANLFKRELNIYSDNSYYFVRISSTEPALRISEIASTNVIENKIVTTFNHFDIHELESRSLVGGGQRWYGELFDLELSQNFAFNVPNKVALDTMLFASSYANGASSGTNTITYSINGTTVYNKSLCGISADFCRTEMNFSYSSNSDNVPINITVNRTNPSTLTYLDKIELNCRRNLIFTGNQMNFRDIKSIGIGNIAKFSLSNFQTNYFVWDVTNKQNPKIIQGQSNGNLFEFNVATDTLREFVVSNGSNFLTPAFVSTVANQNLHGLNPVKLLIVTHPNFLSEANRLAQIHELDGTASIVVTTEQVYNEFSSGMLDPTAIKWFAKMFYDRANGDISKMPENLLLFGDGTYDPKNRVSGNNYFVPVYEVLNSENHIDALVTDDYFGMLDDNEAINNSDMLDIGVGRMIISTNEQATEQVNKVEQYLKKGINTNSISNCSTEELSCSSFGDWRMKYVQIADDEAYFINSDTEPQYDSVTKNHPEMNADKIYLDAYPQTATAGGIRFPEINAAIDDKIQRGALIINYVGHGGEVGVAEERVITIPQIQSWSNKCNLNLFVSATCEFTKYDDPSRVSAGEWAFLNPTGGAIALMTTTRSVFYGVNSETGRNFYNHVFERDANFKAQTFGEIIRKTKNQTTSSTNKRSFTLIGDPALRIALPEFNVKIDSINSFAPSVYQDTLMALSKVRLKGHIEDYNQTILTDFNGVMNPSIFDKKKTLQTLNHNDKTAIIDFEVQKNVLYKGKASVKNGYFDFTFIVPKDIDYAYGKGKISLYANSETNDAGGLEEKIIIGGINPNGIMDNTGPEITMFLNDETFIDGGLTNQSPMLVAKLFDENGINTVGNGIGHDIMAVIDAETANPIVLNEYYSANLDTYQSGSLKYNLRDLGIGNHTLSLKAWDVNNNSSEAIINFEVQNNKDLELRHVLNYPNPFTTNTAFYFEHNQLCNNLEVQIQIFTVSGKLVKTINQQIYNECFRSDGINWDGLDDFGDQLAKGVYIYNLTVTNPNNETANKIEKLVILK